MIQDIKIKLVIDGAEGTTTIKMVGAEAEQLIGKLQGLQSNPALKSFYNDLLTLGEVSEDASQSIVEFVNYNQISEKQLSDVTAKLREEMSVLGIGTKEYKQRQAALANLNNAQIKFQQTQQRGIAAQGRATQGANAMNQAMGQLGWVVGDANMFMVNFRMGMMSIGNNIPMVVQGLMRAKEEAKALGTTFKAQLASSLMGAGGLMLGINALMFALQVLPGLFDDTTKSVKEQTDAVKKLRDEYKNLDTTSMDMEEASLKARLEFLNKWNEQIEGRKKVRTYRDREGIESSLTFWGRAGDEDQFDKNKADIASLSNKLSVLGKIAEGTKSRIESILTGTYDLSSITAVKGAIELLNKEFENVRTEAERQKYRERIAELKELESTMRGIERAGKKAGENFNTVMSRGLRQNKLWTSGGIPGELSPVAVPLRSDPVKETNTQLGIQLASTQFLGQAWQRTGQIMAQSLTRGLGLMNQTNNVMQNIIGSIIEMGLQMAITGAMGGLFSLATGGVGGFMGGFMGALGITPAAEGGIFTKPTLAMIGEGREAEGVFPLSKLSQFMPQAKPNYSQPTQLNVVVSGELTGRGNDLVAVVNKRVKTIKQYYGRSN